MSNVPVHRPSSSLGMGLSRPPTPPTPALTPPPPPDALQYTAPPAVPLQQTPNAALARSLTSQPERKKTFPSPSDFPSRLSTGIPDEPSVSVSEEPPSNLSGAGHSVRTTPSVKDIALFDELVGFISLFMALPVLYHLFITFDGMNDPQETIRLRGGDPTASASLATFWLGFVIELVFCAFVLYDCTALGPGIPGFGKFDKSTLLFGYLRLNDPSSALLIRSFLWILICITVSVTYEYASLSIALAASLYFVCYFGFVRYSSLTHPWFPSFSSQTQSGSRGSSSDISDQPLLVFIPVCLVNLSGACFALAAASMSIQNDQFTMPMWSKALLVVISIMCVLGVLLQLATRFVTSLQHHFGGIVANFTLVYVIFMLFVLATIANGNSGLAPVAFLIVVVLVLAFNILSYFACGSQSGYNADTIITRLRNFIALRNWIRVFMITSVLMVVYSGYIGFRSTTKDFWNADLDVNEEFIPDLDFSALEEPIVAVRDYVDNIDLSFDYSLPDLTSLATFPCTINMGYFSRWIDESDLDFIKQGIGYVAQGITSVTQSAIYAATSLCSGIEQVRDFSLDSGGLEDFLGIKSSALNAIQSAEQYGRQAWAALKGLERRTIDDFERNVRVLGYEAENLLRNITEAFRGYTVELFEDVSAEVRGFNLRTFVIGLVEDIKDVFSFIDIDGFIDDFERGLRKWKEFDISELGEKIIDAIPSAELLEDNSQLFNSNRHETIRELASYSKEERMQFLETSFQTFMAEAEGAGKPTRPKQKAKPKFKRKPKSKEAQKRRGTTELLNYGIGLQDLHKERSDSPDFLSGRSANIRLQQYEPPSIDCDVKEITWTKHALNLTEIADSIEPCLCEVLTATLAVSAVGFFIPGIGAPAQLIRNVARMVIRLLSALKTMKRAVTPIAYTTRNLNTVRQTVSRARTIQASLVASALTRYIIVIVPMLCAIFFLVYLAWQRRTKLSRAMFIQGALMLVSMNVVGLLLLEAHQLVMSFELDFGLAVVTMEPDEGFDEAVRAHVFAIIGLGFFLLSAILFRIGERWESDDDEENTAANGASGETRGAGSSGSSSGSNGDPYNPEKPQPTIATRDGRGGDVTRTEQPLRKKSRTRRFTDWLSEARISLIAFCVATIVLSISAASMPWFDLNASAGSTISELRTVNSTFLDVIQTPLEDIEEISRGCIIDIDLGEFFDFPQFDEIRNGVRDARQQIDDFAEKILPDFEIDVPDLSSLARSTWKIALVAVPLIGSILILITTVAKKNFLSPTQVLFGAVVNLVTSTLVLNNLPGFVSDITDAIPLYNVELVVKDGYFYAFLAHGALWVSLVLLVVDLVAKIRWDEIEEDDDYMQVPLKPTRAIREAVGGSKESSWKGRKEMDHY